MQLLKPDLMNHTQPTFIQKYYAILFYVMMGVERELLRNKFISIEEHRDRIINKILR
jgi:hypothetical protein